MKTPVAVVRGHNKRDALRDLLVLSGFDTTLQAALNASPKPKNEFRIAIKPNLMVFVSHQGKEALITDPELVELLIDHLRASGFFNISVCESQHDVSLMFRNHQVCFVANQAGYRPEGRYRISDLTLEKKPFRFFYYGEQGEIRYWKDFVGTTWQEADFRITFAKCKTHELDYLTLSLKNLYGCMPSRHKIWRYHICQEVPEVTARLLLNFPVHFALIDAWTASDGFQGYKIPRPKNLGMLIAGPDPIAVDMETFRRAGLEWHKSRLIRASIAQTRHGNPPEYEVVGDQTTRFGDLVNWQNIDDETVEDIDILEEVYLTWGVINLKPGLEHFDQSLFPPKNWFWRLIVSLSRVTFRVFKKTSWFKRWYREHLSPEEIEKIEDGEFDTAAILTIVWVALKRLWDKPAVIMWTTLLGLMVWGFHGNMDLLHDLLAPRFGPQWARHLTFGLAWGEQLASFIVGFLAVVCFPALIIRWGFREKLKDYGLGLPDPKDRRKALVIFRNLFGVSAVLVFLASFHPGMQRTYPLFGETITRWIDFILYEWVYLLFFIAIEFIFRGFLLLGLYQIRIPTSTRGASPPPLRFGSYAILIQMLAYTTWHYGKPVPEMIGTLLWGVVSAAIVLRIRSLWPVITAHWLYNVLLDLLIWKKVPTQIEALFSAMLSK